MFVKAVWVVSGCFETCWGRVKGEWESEEAESWEAGVTMYSGISPTTSSSAPPPSSPRSSHVKQKVFCWKVGNIWTLPTTESGDHNCGEPTLNHQWLVLSRIRHQDNLTSDLCSSLSSWNFFELNLAKISELDWLWWVTSSRWRLTNSSNMWRLEILEQNKLNFF